MDFIFTSPKGFNMKKILFPALLILMASCLRLDDLAFMGDNSISEYKFDNYTGETDMQLPPEYDIPASMTHVVNFPSNASDEKHPSHSVIYGVYIGDMEQIENDTIIVYCHGQRDHLDFYWPRAKLLANCGGKNRFGVLMMDYLGFGLSKGKATSEQMVHDVEGSLLWLKKMGADPGKVIIYGFSLGTWPAVYIAAGFKDFKPWKLVTESALASIDNITQESTLLNVPSRFMTDLGMRNAYYIQFVEQYYLWFHGTEDDYIAIGNSELLLKNYNGPYIEIYRVEGAKHGEDGVPQTLGYENYLDILYKFIIRK